MTLLEMIPEIEQASNTEIIAFQNDKLVELLEYLNTNSSFYQRKFKTDNINISEIKTIEDLQQISLTSKDDLQEYNDDFICVERNKIIDYVTTSCTLGKPVTFALTDNDLDRLAYNEAISFACAGVTKDDVVQLMTTMDRRFMAGLAYFLGIRKLGAGMIRVGAGIPELQWDSILKFKPTYLIAVPSFLLKLIQYAEANGIDYNASSVKGVICIGESLRKEDFSLKLHSTYASTEMGTAFTECEHLQGGHHHPELIITEIVDDNGVVVQDGEEGELVITTLGFEALPLLRFKTGDVVKAHYDTCGCGRNTMRLGPVVGRKKQMVKYKGTTLYPPAMHDLLNHFDEVDCYIIEISTNDIGTDEILIKIASEDTSAKFLTKIKDHFRAKLRVAPVIEFHDAKEINKLRFPKMSRKPVDFIDKRI